MFLLCPIRARSTNCSLSSLKSHSGRGAAPYLNSSSLWAATLELNVLPRCQLRDPSRTCYTPALSHPAMKRLKKCVGRQPEPVEFRERRIVDEPLRGLRVV